MATSARPARSSLAGTAAGEPTAPFASAWRRAHLTVGERLARGKPARVEASRSSHGKWGPAPGSRRAGPLAVGAVVPRSHPAEGLAGPGCPSPGTPETLNAF